MSARGELWRRVVGAFVNEAKANALLDAYHAEVLAEAIAAARSEYLTDGTGTDEDAAYNNGITDAVAAIGALLEGGAGAAPKPDPADVLVAQEALEAATPAMTGTAAAEYRRRLNGYRTALLNSVERGTR